MNNNQTPHILARLEIGFRTNSGHLKELEKDLSVALQRARQFGTEYGSADDWHTNWQRQWDNVEEILRRISALVNSMDGYIANSDSDRLKQSLETWEAIQAEDSRLVDALSDLRAQAVILGASVQKDWNAIERTLESHLEIIRACAQALRVRLELLKAHSKEDVDHMVQDILSKLPNRARAEGLEAGLQVQDYVQAAAELEEERHKYLGFMDVVKSLFLWVETVDERTHKNLAVEIEKV